jgi:hypothetical protein
MFFNYWFRSKVGGQDAQTGKFRGDFSIIFLAKTQVATNWESALKNGARQIL